MNPLAETIITENKLLGPIFWSQATAENVARAIEEKNDPHERYTDGRSPLHMAAACGRETKAIERLLEENVDKEVRDEMGRTPLHMAVMNENTTQIVELLLEKGVNGAPRDVDGNTPFDYTRKHAAKNKLIKRNRAYWLLNDAYFNKRDSIR